MPPFMTVNLHSPTTALFRRVVIRGSQGAEQLPDQGGEG
jgi:hypothetical protein